MKINKLKEIIREELASIKELGFDYPGKTKSLDLDQESEDYRRGYTDGLRDGYDRGFKDAETVSESETKEAPPKTTPKTKPGNPGLTPTPGKTPKERPAKAKTNEDKAATLVKGIMNKYKKLKK
jgi:hypothetical protein